MLVERTPLGLPQLLAIAAVLAEAVLLFVVPIVGGVILAAGVVLLVVFVQIPARHTLYECPRCGAAFHVSIAEYYLCDRKDGAVEAECKKCRMEEWLRPVNRGGG
jgi:hypothetical protein